jgi:hypothetical protein
MGFTHAAALETRRLRILEATKKPGTIFAKNLQATSRFVESTTFATEGEIS